jgi:hypothetical protein
MTSWFLEFLKVSRNIWQAQIGNLSRKFRADENHIIVDDTMDEC